MKVLYIHHAAPFGGASRSLFELLRAFPEDAIQACVLTRRGQFQAILQGAQIDVIGCGGIAQFDNTRYSHYRGMRWLVLLRELAYLPTTFFGLLAAKRRWGTADLVHVNDMTLVPVVWMAKKLFDCPVVMHVRSVQRPLNDLRGKFLRGFFKKNVDRFIAIDETVKRSLDDDFKAIVVHNGLNVSAQAMSCTKREDEKFTVGMVGGLSKAKGCLELIEAAKICCDQGVDVRFVFIGQSMRPPARLRDSLLRFAGISQEIYEEMQARIIAYSLESTVEFWPFTTQLDQVYGKLDVLCFPSHFDAPGRPIFEAALFGIPSIAAITQPTADTIIEGVTGLTVQPKSPDELAKAIMTLYSDPQKRHAMGASAKALADQNFDIKNNALKVLEVYRTLLKASA